MKFANWPVLVLALSPAILCANDTADLDDIGRWNTVPMEVCLDQALDTVPGHPRKLEFKLEGDDPTYEFDIETPLGVFNVECNAEEGLITEIEREVGADDDVFKRLAKVSETDARKTALEFNPGEVVASERELSSDGKATYEFDIQTNAGYEIKVDVDATTGEIEEANIEIYEIGPEKE
ncbi:MAG: PepSY domain-containing protein [Pseudomonadota bacterium]